MNHKILTLVLFIIFLSQTQVEAQSKKTLTIDQVIDMAVEQSPRAIMARHTFRASYWSFKSFRSNYLPSLTLITTPLNLNRSFESITLDDGSDGFVERSAFRSSGNLEISQRIAPTGGDLFVNTSLERVELLSGDKVTTYYIAPVNIGYRQPLVTFNAYKWEQKIEPLRYKEAKREYLSTLEDISRMAISYFFDLSLAQINKEISESNFYNNDTLYKIAQGRYNMGTIAKDELLQMELSYLTSRKAFNEADLNLRIARFNLQSFLGITDDSELSLIIPSNMPEFKINVDSALHYAFKNNPQIIALERQKIEANRDVAEARANNLFNASLNATVGLNKYSDNLTNTFDNLENSQIVSVGISIPILDWGVGRGRYEMAKSQRELTLINIEQEQVDFDQQVFLEVARFNMQDEQLLIAAKSDTIARIRYDITKQRFKVGKVSITDLNIALQEKDVSRRDYISALRAFWQNYYKIRGFTLYDFINKKELDVSFEQLIEN
jgi:outer membrane protein TolC